MLRHLPAFLSLLVACAPAVTSPRQAAPPSAPATVTASAPAPAADSGAPATNRSSTPAQATSAPLDFIENDFARALALAKSRNVPVFVDAWAPWCHTCLSLREFVLEDPRLQPLADKLVFAAVDTELEANRAFVDKYAQKNWPTLWVIDSASEKPLLKWVGALSVGELKGLLESVVDTSAPADTREALTSWVHGQSRFADGDVTGAIAEYEATLTHAPAGWPQRGVVVDALLARLSEARRFEDCAERALGWAPALASGSAKADALGIGLGCGTELKGAKQERLLAKLLPLVTEELADPRSAMLADDRSGLYDTLLRVYQALKRDAAARATAEQWAAFLEKQAAHAQTPAERAVFDSHRLAAYLELKRLDAAQQMLSQSERELPNDYNPPARLARVYLESKRFAEAEQAIQRALARAYGPRKLRLFLLQQEILSAQGRDAEAVAALQTAVEFGKSTSLPGSYAELYKEVQTRLARALAKKPRASR